MSELSQPLKEKILLIFNEIDNYNIQESITKEQARDYSATELSNAITEWLSNLRIVIPTGSIQVQGSQSAQTNVAPITLELRISLKP